MIRCDMRAMSPQLHIAAKRITDSMEDADSRCSSGMKSGAGRNGSRYTLPREASFSEGR